MTCDRACHYCASWRPARRIFTQVCSLSSALLQVTGHAIAQPYPAQQPMQMMPMQPVMAQPYMPPGQQQQYGQQYGQQQYPQQPVVMAQPYVPGQPVMAQAYTPPGK